MRDPDVQRLAPAPVPADVGIVMALPIEAGYLTDSLNKVRKYSARTHTVVEGELAGKIVAVILAGVSTHDFIAWNCHTVYAHQPPMPTPTAANGRAKSIMQPADIFLFDDIRADRRAEFIPKGWQPLAGG